MSKVLVSSLFSKSSYSRKLGIAITNNENKTVISGLVGSSFSIVISEVFNDVNRPFLIVLNDKEEAAYHLNDLENLLGEKNVLFYPGSYRRPYQIEETDNANILLRSEVLNRINSRKKPAIIVSYPEALFEKVITKKELERHTLKIDTGDDLSIDFVNEVLFEYNFKRTDFVTEPGEFSVRGGILDVFSFSNDNPYRIEFFGDEVESIRSFDVETQLSTEFIKKITIIPNMENKMMEEKRISFLKYMASKTIVFYKNEDLLYQGIDKLFNQAEDTFNALDGEINQSNPNELFCSSQLVKKELEDYTKVQLINTSNNSDINFNTQPQPSFNKQFNLLIDNLNTNTEKGFKNYIFCSSHQQEQRFHDIFDDIEQHVNQFETVVFPLYEGFVDSDQKNICYTDHQIFERYHKFQLKNGYAKKQAITIKELTNLEVGDYVTHIDHGIGKFGGLQKIDVEGKQQEAIKLIYGERDILYLSIHSLHKISKYSGKDGTTPKIYKLGSGVWKKLKQKTKKRVKEIAFNLIELYAKRRTLKGFAYNPDSYLQLELESSFIYEDTPDQITATADIKRDMENERPMDRLVCGDVGFGKTEVAIRAAFKAVTGGTQVAILAPTTVLAQQHWRTFKARMSDYPIEIKLLTRLQTPAEIRETLEGLRDGKVDIVIGTHRLLSTGIEYQKIGLLVVDEEQRFGVRHKEILKERFRLIDVLTLSATPIPRTLYLSLMGARDMSTIDTPPPNRLPVQTSICAYDERLIRNAIRRELTRGGQVFFLHNRVATIVGMKERIQSLVPEAKVIIGHGQMDRENLELVMHQFVEGKADVLLATTIIESGIDIPNANTILIDRADRFGLADLYQLRGRVGRAGRRAYALLLLPGDLIAGGDARKRLSAIKQYTELGSGFKIAMRDLEIRGAGSLLGTKQSGHITAVGFELYCQLLQQSVEHLQGKRTIKRADTQVRIDFIAYSESAWTGDTTKVPAFFPRTFGPDPEMRVAAYRQLASARTEKEIKAIEKDWRDRFGRFPDPVKNLIETNRLRVVGSSKGVQMVEISKDRLMLQRNGDYILPPGGKFPRLSSRCTKDKLSQAVQLLRTL